MNPTIGTYDGTPWGGTPWDGPVARPVGPTVLASTGDAPQSTPRIDPGRSTGKGA